jgi:hypothetical protein
MSPDTELLLLDTGFWILLGVVLLLWIHVLGWI